MLKKIKGEIPNILTLFNLFFGSISIIFLFSENFIHYNICILISIIFDYLDGFTSRIMKKKSNIGRELDSLADMVSFGLTPSISMFLILKKSNIPFIGFFSFLISIFSAYRLAKFNINKKKIGLTTTINALFFSSLSVILQKSKLNEYLILFLIFCSCYLLISEINMLSMNFNGYTWKNNKKRYIFLLISIFLLLTLHTVAIPCIIILYITISIYYKIMKNSYLKK
ncbi:CDP-alcohol phosphatidyltransferase family protein [Blattabacterium cuenoti]|uniref:CDP-alcohol phosphatidyltransferase family protein n=1 Tax=Blattabacterium cuenoti TaxID=1653831 RepID=UPI00293BB17D|nr:CDP-alcohol phosphatidyltransferase family protein [Blattabacterium cuenoti]